MSAPVQHGDTQPLTFTYRNWRGEVGLRTIAPYPVSFWFGENEWHPEPQWLMHAFDMDKQAFRYFAARDILGFSPAPSSDTTGAA